MSTVSAYKPTQDAQTIVSKFKAVDEQYRSQWDEFYEKHRVELDAIDALREGRNVALDEARKVLGSEVERLDPERYKTVKYEMFEVQKKKSSPSFRATEFVKVAKELGIDKAMKEEGVIATKVEINYDAALEYLKKNKIEKKFEVTLDQGASIGIAIKGPKPIPAFGQEASTK